MGKISDSLQALYDQSVKADEVAQGLLAVRQAYTLVVQAGMALQGLMAKDSLALFDVALSDALQTASAALMTCQNAIQGSPALEAINWTPTQAVIAEE